MAECYWMHTEGFGGVWGPPEVNTWYWLPTTSSYGKGHIVNEGGYNSDFFGGSDPPPETERPRILIELIEPDRLVGSDR